MSNPSSSPEKSLNPQKSWELLARALSFPQGTTELGDWKIITVEETLPRNSRGEEAFERNVAIANEGPRIGLRTRTLQVGDWKPSHAEVIDVYLPPVQPALSLFRQLVQRALSAVVHSEKPSTEHVFSIAPDGEFLQYIRIDEQHSHSLADQALQRAQRQLDGVASTLEAILPILDQTS